MLRVRLFITVSAVALLAVVAAARAQSIQPGTTALDLETRMSQLEDQMRTQNGRIEELTNQINQLKQQLDLQKSDTDLRFSQLQGGGAPTAAPPPGDAIEQPPQPKPPQGAGDMSQAPTRSGNLGTLAAPNAPAQAPPPQTAATGGGLPSGSPQDQYNYAFGLVQQAKYPAAAQAMRSFVQNYPKDPLASNAQYWLGASYYVLKDYNNAATAFAQGYEKYPHGAKAPDDLLYLGMSLMALNQKADACKAYARLDHDFPSASQPIKDRLASEKHRAGC